MAAAAAAAAVAAGGGEAALLVELLLGLLLEGALWFSRARYELHGPHREQSGQHHCPGSSSHISYWYEAWGT